MEGGSSKKTIGRSKVLYNQSREIVADVFRVMKKGAESGGDFNLNKVQKCVVEATGISGCSLKRILKEEKMCVLLKHTKKWHKIKVITDSDYFDVYVVKWMIN